MPYDPNIHHRRSIRLQGYDYSRGGLYFVTLCCHQRQPLFGKIVDDAMELNAAGRIVLDTWQLRGNTRPQEQLVKLGAFVVMPNHVHGIVEIEESCVTGGHAGAMNRAPTLGTVVRAFKARCTHAINSQGNHDTVWQRNYYEHVIRDDEAHAKILNYIQTNPQRWKDDTYHVGD